MFASAGQDPTPTRPYGHRTRETLQLVDTVYERVLRTQQVDVEHDGEGARLILPVTGRGDAIGLLELILPHYPDAQIVADVAATAHVLAYIVVANRRQADLFEWGQRTTPFSLAAEIQRRLLPSSFTLRSRTVHHFRLDRTGQRRRR